MTKDPNKSETAQALETGCSNAPGPYDDIIGLPRHVSARHPHMSLHDRAAQFSPFAALTGFEDTIQDATDETADRMQKADENEVAYDLP